MKNVIELLKEYEEVIERKEVINDDLDEFLKEIEDNEMKESMINHHHKDELKLFLNTELCFYVSGYDEDDNKHEEKIIGYLTEIDIELRRIGLVEDEDYSVYYNELYEHNIVGVDIFTHQIYIRNTTLLHRMLKIRKLQRRLKG